MEEVLKATSWLKGVTEQKREYIYNFLARAERETWGYMDVAARYHTKSLCLTYAGLIQQIIKNPEVTIGLFSYKSKLAKSFLAQIKQEFETNDYMKYLFDDILYAKPDTQSPKWSENEGILVKRQGNPREVTLTASGLIDGQLTGAHYNILWFDDAIEKEAGGSQYMMAKAEEAMRLAIGGLGTHDKVYGGVGTRWNLMDAYFNLDRDKVMRIRRTEAATPNKRDGEPQYLTAEEWENAKLEFTPYQFSCQMLNDPQAASSKRFNYDWLQWYDKVTDGWRRMNRYIIVDPANTKKKHSDYTAMVVMGVQGDGNYYLLDAVHDKLSLPERIEKLLGLYEKWKPKLIGYEKYGMQADIEAIKMKLADEMLNLPLIELGGKTKKEDRIEGLMPICQKNKLYLPKKLMYYNWEGMNVDIIDFFVNWEYLPFPNGQHDDLLDAMARITDPAMKVKVPEKVTGAVKYGGDYRQKTTAEEYSWLSA